MQSLSSTVIQLQGVQVRGIGDPSPPNPPAPGRFGGGRPTSPLSSQQSPTATSPPGDDAASSSRQRRPRSRRDKDKRFTCDYEGCDKTYTRAEHLTRHKLNRIIPFISFLSRADQLTLQTADCTNTSAELIQPVPNDL